MLNRSNAKLNLISSVELTEQVYLHNILMFMSRLTRQPGRRKTSIARVFLTPVTTPGEGYKMTINGRNYIDYFSRHIHRYTCFQPLLLTGTYGMFNIRVDTYGNST